MDKNAFKIICDLIYRQVITYDEAQVLTEAIMEKPASIIANPVNWRYIDEKRTGNPNIWPEPGTNPYRESIFPQKKIIQPMGSANEQTFDCGNENTTVSGTGFSGFSGCRTGCESDNE